MYLNYTQLLEQTRNLISEIMPWDYTNFLAISQAPLIVDVREKEEFQQIRIENSISAPRGILENACLWDFFETIPELAAAQHRPILLVCRSGYRSVFAALSMQQLGFENVTSLKLGLKGLNDEEIPLLDSDHQRIDGDTANDWLSPPVRADQRAPKLEHHDWPGRG